MKKLFFICCFISETIFAQSEVNCRFDEISLVNFKDDKQDYNLKMYTNTNNRDVFAISYGDKVPLEIYDFSAGKHYHLKKNLDAEIQESSVVKSVYEHQTDFALLKEIYSKNIIERTYQIKEGIAGIDTLIIVVNSHFKARNKRKFYSKTTLLFSKAERDYWKAFDHVLNTKVALLAPLKFSFPIKIISFTEEVKKEQRDAIKRSGSVEYRTLKKE
ncbi:hypothetical protein [Flavobacterium sp.]|uniref:hypothetical protein n=1 Tax=Flavobacterium sp. TaxID=239 RepID=UPI002604052B|nr:hypothetical protein [Flavobacterium sp.]